MGIISKIKAQAAKTGSNKDKILYCKENAKVRVRFLQEIDDGHEVVCHDSYADGIDTICRQEFGDDCPMCDNESLRTRSKFAWSVWNYDTKKVELAYFAVNNCTPVQTLMDLSETYNTIMDRDYVLKKTGSQQNTQYSVTPMDKNKFKNDKAKPYSKTAALKILDKAFPFNELDDDDEDEEEEKPAKKKSKKPAEKPAKKSGKKDKEYAALNDDETEEELDIDWMEEHLDEEDIDIDEFCEFCEVKSLKKLKGKSEKQFKKLIKTYLESLEEEEDDDDDDEDDDED